MGTMKNRDRYETIIRIPLAKFFNFCIQNFILNKNT